MTAPRPTWKGVLKISLVTIPIKVFPATESSPTISFNQLHSTCTTRIGQRKWCIACDREVPNAEIVKGYEFEKGRYVVIHEDEFDAVKPESTRVIDLVQFRDADELDPIAIDRSYYLVPASPLAAESFAFMRAVMKAHVGLGKLAIYGREYLVAVRPFGPAFLLHTLHHAAEIRPLEGLLEDLSAAPMVRAPEQLRVGRQVIAALRGDGPLNLADFTDEYQADLRRLIDAKIAGEEIVVPPVVDVPTVWSLQEQLTQSLAAVKSPKILKVRKRA